MIKVSGLTFLLLIELIVILAGLGVFLLLKNKRILKSAETQKKDNPKKRKEDAQMKTEETSNKTEESAETKAKEAPTAAGSGAPAKTNVNAKNTETENKGKTEEAAAAKTDAAASPAEKNDEVNIDDLLEAVQDTVGENDEETLDLIEEVFGTTDENSEVKAEGPTKPAADSPETKGIEEAAKTTATEAVEEVANTADERSDVTAKSPSSDTEVQSIDIKDFKSLLAEREVERQHLKNKVKELEEALTKKTQELDQKIEKYKSFQESEKELLAIYKKLKESSVAP